jgi:hypothetical protein
VKCNHRNKRNKINLLLQQCCNPHIKVRSRYLQTMACIKGERMNKKTRRKKYIGTSGPILHHHSKRSSGGPNPR